MEANNKDTRWVQRYDSFHRALGRILAVTESERLPQHLSELEKEGLVQRFEYTFELAWKVLQDLLRDRGYNITPGPRSVLAKSFEDELILNHDAWRAMAAARNTTTHTYNEGEAELIVKSIYNNYAPLLVALDDTLNQELLYLKAQELLDEELCLD